MATQKRKTYVSDDDWVNAGLAEQLYAALHRCGTVTIRLADLGRHAGLTTDFHRGEVAVDHTLDFPTFRGTLTHELTHLRRGPVPGHLADAEEVAVRYETADILLPALRFASRHRATVADWDETKLTQIATAERVDRGVVRDAISPPTMPFPAIAVVPDTDEGAA